MQMVKCLINAFKCRMGSSLRVCWTGSPYVRDYMENQPLQLEAELDIGFNEKQMVTLKNGITLAEVQEYIDKAMEEVYSV